ncbi:recombinase family protein [uncultured Helicobacter sp.]|nr:recombinase family protein [uncultured Helicobacter sp.]
MIVAYVRVSTILQNEARQLELIKQEQCNKVFIEKLSGSKAENRPPA